MGGWGRRPSTSDRGTAEALSTLDEREAQRDEEKEREADSSNFTATLKRICRRPRFWLFLVCVCTCLA